MEFLERAWSDPYQAEHATYPIDWFRTLAMRRAIAQAYDSGQLQVRACDPGAEMSLPHQLLKAWLLARLGETSAVDFRWTSGSSGCRLEGEEPMELTLLDDVQAVRVALDRADRDPVFAQTLTKLLSLPLR
jgi:hypothetical protein